MAMSREEPLDRLPLSNPIRHAWRTCEGLLDVLQIISELPPRPCPKSYKAWRGFWDRGNPDWSKYSREFGLNTWTPSIVANAREALDRARRHPMDDDFKVKATATEPLPGWNVNCAATIGMLHAFVYRPPMPNLPADYKSDQEAADLERAVYTARNPIQFQRFVQLINDLATLNAQLVTSRGEAIEELHLPEKWAEILLAIGQSKGQFKKIQQVALACGRTNDSRFGDDMAKMKAHGHIDKLNGVYVVKKS